MAGATKEKKPPAQERRCQRGAGTEKQCRAARMGSSQFCFFHDPGDEILHLLWARAGIAG